MPTPTLLLLFLLFRLSYAVPCIGLDPPGPFVVALNKNRASLVTNISICHGGSITVSAIPSRLTPSLSVKSLSSGSDPCQILRTVSVFHSRIGKGELMFATSNCTIFAPIVVTGVRAFHLPSRDLITAVPPQTILMARPGRLPVNISFAVHTVLPTGETFRGRKAANELEVKFYPRIPSVTASLGVGNHFGNLLIASADDGSDVPRPEIVQAVKLLNPKSQSSALFRILHAPLVPTVLTVRAPARLSPNGGDKIVLVVRRTAADRRRLIIGDVALNETRYVRRGINYISSFITPPLPRGRRKWRLELIKGDSINFAEDTSGHVFKVTAKPNLTSLLPAVAKPGTEGFVIISGSFEDSVMIFVEGEPLSSGDVVHRTSGEIIMRLPRVSPTFKGNLTVLVRSVRGGDSNALDLTFDPDAVYVDAEVAHASSALSNGRFVVPFVCNYSEPPVIFARADTPQDVFEPPFFNFSVRTSASPGVSFSELSYGPSGMVSLDADLFGEDAELENEFVTVLIVVTQADRSGKTLIFISRQTRRDVIGVTVLPPLEGQRGAGRVLLEAQISRLNHCRNASNFKTQTVWSINKRTIISTDSSGVNARQENSAETVDLGRTLIVPGIANFSFAAVVDVTDRSTGKTIATGRCKSRKKLRVLAPSLLTSLNGGLSSTRLPLGVDAYEIHGIAYGNTPNSAGRMEYAWDCKSLSSETLSCPEALFPSAVRKSREHSSFNVTTIDVRDGEAVEYFLTVRSGASQLGNARLRLFVSSAEATIFPSSKISPSMSTPHVLSDGVIQFSCYHSIIVSVLDSGPNRTYDFALFREKEGNNLLKSSTDDLLISHSGYWSPQERNGVLFGIQGNKLKSANYTLYGRTDGKAGPGRGVSWKFQVKRCPILVAYKLPYLLGIVDQTTFFAGAASVPPSRNLFYFVLTRQKRRGRAPVADPSGSPAYLPGCSGGQLCTFFVSAPGRYLLRIDMYDPSGTRMLLSETISTPITVVAPNVTADSNLSSTASTEPTVRAAAVEAALLQEDKGAFLHDILRFPRRESLKISLFEKTVQSLQKLSSSPTLDPVQGSLILAACSRMLLLEQVHHDPENIVRLRRLVETVITNSVSNEGPSIALRDRGVDFYSFLIRESSNFVPKPDKENATAAGDIARMSRFSAAMHLPLILAAGRECGYNDQLVMTYPSLTRFNVSLGAPTVARHDDYRISISCFNGQVSRLLPEPTLTELCPQSKSESGTRIFTAPQVLVSVEQDDLIRRLSPTEQLSGPTILTRVMRFKTVNNSMLLEEDIQSNNTCYKTRVSVYVSRELAEDLAVSTKGTDFACEQSGLPIGSFNIEEKNTTSLEIEARTFTIGSDGRVSSFLEASPPISARMTVNGTRLRQCLATTRIEGNDSSRRTVIIASVLGVGGFFLVCVTVVLCCIRYRRRNSFSVPESLAPWEESFEMNQSRTQSTLGSYYYASGELHRRPNGWEGEYIPVQSGYTGSSRKESGARIEEEKEAEPKGRAETTSVSPSVELGNDLPDVHTANGVHIARGVHTSNGLGTAPGFPYHRNHLLLRHGHR